MLGAVAVVSLPEGCELHLPDFISVYDLIYEMRTEYRDLGKHEHILLDYLQGAVVKATNTFVRRDLRDQYRD